MTAQNPFTSVPVWVAYILCYEGVSVRDIRVEDLATGEIGTLDLGFVIIESGNDYSSSAAPNHPKQITHGPQRKGRGGKIRRW